MNKKKVLYLMKEIVEVGKNGDYSPEEFKSAIDGVKYLIEDKIKENDKNENSYVH